MENWRLSDPAYVAFEPVTVQQAILRFRRLQSRGLSPWRYPECFVECARKLPPAEVAKFESWLVNPQGEDAGALTVQEFRALPAYTPEDDEKTMSLPKPICPESEEEHL